MDKEALKILSIIGRLQDEGVDPPYTLAQLNMGAKELGYPPVKLGSLGDLALEGYLKLTPPVVYPGDLEYLGDIMSSDDIKDFRIAGKTRISREEAKSRLKARQAAFRAIYEEAKKRGLV